jgi:hypothetical protein
MATKTISMCQGKGSLSHNNREFSAKNIDPERTPNNVIFRQESLPNAYEKCFGKAVENYNAKQKRNDRKIKDGYFQHLFHREPSKNVLTGTNKQKSFYEDLVQIGTMKDTGIGTADSEIAAKCLTEYIQGFQQRNPNFYVFNAILHMDEATPHLHIDYIPVGHFNSGIKTRNAMAQALKEMGYGDGKNAINRWRLAEWNVLNQICKAHGIEISEPKKSRGFDFTSEEYKAYQDEIHALEDAKDRAESELLDTQDELKRASEKKSKLTKIDSIETKKSVFGNKVSLLQEDYDELVTLAKKQIASVKNNKKLKSEKETLLQMVADYEKKVKDLESELAQYKKPATISRDVLKKQAKEISEKEQLKIKLRKAMAVIDAYGLHEEYERIKVNSTKNRNELE